jgi:TRAP-type transport system periplasmic protein
MSYFKKRASLILAIILVLTFALTGCGSSQDKQSEQASDEVTEWSFYSAYGQDEGVCCEIWPKLFEQVKEATGGRLVITTYWYGQHPYEGEDMLKALQDGTCQMSHFYSGYLSSVEPVFGADAVPMLFPSDSMKSWEVTANLWGNFKQDKSGVLEGILEDRWNASMVHMLPASPQRIFSNGFDVGGLGSLKGHKIRVYSPELGKLVEIMGGTPVSVAFSEVYTSLSTNLIDGYITSVMFANSGGLFDFTDTINDWEIAASTDGLMVSLDALNSLPPDVKEAFLKVMGDSAMKPETLEIDKNIAIVDELTNAGTVKVFTPSEEKRAEVVKVIEKEIWAPWLETTGEDGQKVIDQIKKLSQ